MKKTCKKCNGKGYYYKFNKILGQIKIYCIRCLGRGVIK